jgi:peroxiredoxin
LIAMSKPAPAIVSLAKGDPAPWFYAQALSGAPRYAFDAAGGRAILMLFFGTAREPACAAALAKIEARQDLFDDERGCFFGITVDPEDASQRRIAPRIPGIRHFLDFDFAVSRAYGAIDPDGRSYCAFWLLLDRAMRVAGRFALGDADAAIDAYAALSAAPAGDGWAPVAVVSDIFEPELCQRLIDLYEADGGHESAFMRDVDGVTRALLDPSHKVRRDYLVSDPELTHALHLRIKRRLDPMLKRIFQFEPTRIERMLVACYEAETGGHFRPHRDNTTFGTAHRKFAVTINLNAGDYEGGDLRFPEFGPRTYRAPTGGAIVFSCSLLHEATRVTHGRRFAFLPFLYDEEGAALRERNAKFTEGELARYKAAHEEKERGPPG